MVSTPIQKEMILMQSHKVINILVRTSNRPKGFARMLASVMEQTFTDWQMIVLHDCLEALTYIPNHPKVKVISGQINRQFPYFWNLYCNELKHEVSDGWFFYLDDDDYLINKFALAQIAPLLKEDEGLICQFMRNKIAKPQKVYMKSKQIVQGKIGGGCLFLHSKHKDIADWDGYPAADYRWIKAVSEKLPINFVSIPVTVTGGKGLGKI